MKTIQEMWVAKRYLLSSKDNNFISLISAISIFGITIAVSVLIIVLSVVNGFEKELREKLLSVSAHANIEDSTGTMENWSFYTEKAKEHTKVTSAAPYLNGKGLVVMGKKFSGIEFRGIESTLEETVSNIETEMISGTLHSLKKDEFNIILGSDLANHLDVVIGDKVILNIAESIATPMGKFPRSKIFNVSGIFRIGMYEFDRRLVFIDLSDAQKLLNKNSFVDGIRLSINDIYQSGNVVREVALSFDGEFLINDWTRNHVNLFRSIQITKSILFVILLMAVAVAVFNIISTLVMVVNEKQSDIAILRTLGAKPMSILKIFLNQGSIIGFLGISLGVFIGTFFTLNLVEIVSFFENIFDFKVLAADVYFISDLPTDLRWIDIVKISAITFLLTILATLIPAMNAVRTNPSEVLRYD
ncbi:uncharacterized protein METZ01_LOCUS37896 [marine metagenome]|uniref:ABC3 transporter permease protein domain-containing protein n=1 Tax=marine metagenome TaxID=408172 RepID=A0A381R011_9ZZZZ